MLEFDDLMELAIERIRPYLPDMYEIDDVSWGDNVFQIRIFDAHSPETYRPVDSFRFYRMADETDEEIMERFDRTVQEYAEGWRK